MIDTDNLKRFVRGEPYSPELVDETIRDITALVINRHFSKYVYLMDDMYGIAQEKAISLLRAPYIQLDRNLVNFLYTGIRNNIGHMVSAREKTTVMSADDLDLFAARQVGVSEDVREMMRLEASRITDRFRLLGRDIGSEFEGFFGDGTLPAGILGRTVLRAAIYRTVKSGR